MSDPLIRDRDRLRAFRAYVPPAASAILHLDALGCRWPLDEPESEAFRFCAAPRERGCYCSTHHRLSIRGGH